MADAFSDVSIANVSLVACGRSPITSFDDGTTDAKIIKVKFENVRQEVLAAHPWNPAITRAALAEIATPPPFGYAHRYQLPSNCLRVLSLGDPSDVLTFNGYIVYDQNPRWKIEGRELLTDDTAANIIYIFLNTDPNTYSPLLRMAMSARLSAEIAFPLTKSAALVKTMWELYGSKLREARSIDGMEGEHDVFSGDPLIVVR